MQDKEDRIPDEHGFTKPEAKSLLETYRTFFPDKHVRIEQKGRRWRLVDKDGGNVAEYAWNYTELRLIFLNRQVQTLDRKLDRVLGILGAAVEAANSSGQRTGFYSVNGAPLELPKKN